MQGPCHFGKETARIKPQPAPGRRPEGLDGFFYSGETGVTVQKLLIENHAQDLRIYTLVQRCGHFKEGLHPRQIAV
jgi:hypothetical protein